jgi:hypothetical protein
MNYQGRGKYWAIAEENVCMSRATLDRIVEEIKTLAPDEWQQLREILDTMLLPAGTEDKRKALHQALRAAGLVTQIRQPRAADTPHRHRIEAQGKPVSETIIERAMTLAETHGRRGYDAVQLAAACEVNALSIVHGLPPLTFVSADNALNAAATGEGFSIDNPNAHP